MTISNPQDSGAIDAQSTADKKWGKAVMKHGFCLIPSILLRAQQRLGLNPTQLAVLLQLCEHWWSAERKPYPSKETLGERLGLKPRQVQRYTRALEQAGLLSRVKRYANNGGRQSNEYDLSGLVSRLTELAPEFEQVKEARRQVVRKGGLKPAKAKQ